jgi:inner membrane protein
MTGKTHKLIGIAAGGAIAYTGITGEAADPAALLYLLAVPMGAMIPDIDHDNSKLGRGRKGVMTAISSLFGSIALVAIAFYLMDAYRNDKLLPAISVVLAVVIPFLLLASLSQVPAVRKNLKFMSKHRGLMHTLILPAGMFAAGMFGAEFFGQKPTFAILLTGVNIGYITHIVSDMMTTHGCPVLYPLSKKNIRFMRIQTGSSGEYIAGLILAVIFAAIFLIGFKTNLINLHPQA